MQRKCILFRYRQEVLSDKIVRKERQYSSFSRSFNVSGINTDAIKADTVTVNSGTHILYEKVEYVTLFAIRGGTFLSIATTNSPVDYKSTIANASGAISNKDLCIVGKYFTVMMGSARKTVILQKDYTEKMSVIFASETQGACTIVIGQNEKTEALTAGKIY